MASDLTDRVVLDDRLVQDLLPGPIHRPASQPSMGGFPRPVALEHIPPRRPGRQFEQDRVDYLPVITPAPAVRRQ